MTDLHKIPISSLQHKYFHQSSLPEAFNEYLTVNVNVHWYDTKTTNDIHLPSC
jgi:hypothetical protein